MTPLSQQLEDKKKGCKEQIEKYDLILKCGDWLPTEFDRIKVYCPQCQEIIAILEQAIAEMQKQRQEVINECKLLFIEWFEKDEFDMKDYTGWYYFDWLKTLEKLNQPKTEHEDENQHI